MNDNPRANGSRGRDPYAALRLIALIAAIVGVIVLAAAAFVLSYGGIHKIALSAGVSPNVARIFPVIFDAMLVVSCAAVVSLRSAGWWQRAYSWLSLLALLVVVAAADAAHATGTHIPRKPAAATVAILPWALLLLAFSLLLSMLRQFRRARAAAADAVAADAAAAEAGSAAAEVVTSSAAAETVPVGTTSAGPAPAATALAGTALAGTSPAGTGRPESAAAGASTGPGLDILNPRDPAQQPAVAGPTPGATPADPSSAGPAPADPSPASPASADVAQARPPEPSLRLGEAAAGAPAEPGLNGSVPAGSAHREPPGQDRADQEPVGEEQAVQEQVALEEAGEEEASGDGRAEPAPEAGAQTAEAQSPEAQPAGTPSLLRAQPADAPVS